MLCLPILSSDLISWVYFNHVRKLKVLFTIGIELGRRRGGGGDYTTLPPFHAVMLQQSKLIFESYMQLNQEIIAERATQGVHLGLHPILNVLSLASCDFNFTEN